MRKLRGLLLLFVALLLPGCSLLEEVNNTLTYTTEATALINDASQFAEQVPQLAEQALANISSMEALEQELQNMRQRIIDFNLVVPPDFATGLHTRLESYTAVMQQQIDLYLQQINDNVIDLEALLQSPLVDTARNMQQLLEEINNLGQ